MPARPPRHRTALVAVGTVLTLAGCSMPTADRATSEQPSATSADPSPTTPAPDRPRPSRTAEEPPVRPTPDAAEQEALDRRLIAAAWDDDVVQARRLVARGADVDAQDSTQQSAFLIAASEGYADLLRMTLRHGADVDSRDSFDGTALIRAAERGHWEVVGELVRAGVRLDHVNNLGWTALHEAVILGDGSERYVDTVRVLVAAGVDVSIPTRRDGLTALDHARSSGYDAIASLLEAADRPLGGAAGPQLLAGAAAGRPDEVALALRGGAALEVRDERARTPLLLAVTHDRVAVARVLVALGADPDALDDRHDTPWLVTGVTGSVAMLELLLPADPDLTIRNRYGGVSVIPASERGHVAYVRRVVQTGIDVDHVNDLGWTALLEAVILGDGSDPYQQIVRILLEAGADPGIADADGVTALEHARARGQEAVARLLER